MLKFKDAVIRSKELLEDVQPTAPSTVRLEEAELSDDERYWQVTLSYIIPHDSVTEALQQLSGSSLFRKHVVIKLRAEDGQLFGVRNLAA